MTLSQDAIYSKSFDIQKHPLVLNHCAPKLVHGCKPQTGQQCRLHILTLDHFAHPQAEGEGGVAPGLVKHLAIALQLADVPAQG